MHTLTTKPVLPSARWIAKWLRRVTLIAFVIHVFVYLGTGGESITLVPVIILMLAMMMGWIGITDSRWRQELVFLQSLGISQITIAVTWAIAVILIEIVITVFASLIL